MSKTIDEMIAVMTAFKNGAKIEKVAYGIPVDWVDSENPEWNWKDFDYRVKKQPKYRAYENTEEMIDDFCARFGVTRTKFGEPFIWLKRKNDDNKAFLVNAFDFENPEIEINCAIFCLDYVFDNFTYFDGSPVGETDCT